MAGRRKGTFAFDLSHPVKKGVLLKQGAFHKAFKYRFFLVYPGFLVYYDQESKWLLDLTKGETLGGRLGAIKLKGGSCNIARDAPKACKFGFIVHAPDPLNKRPTYLINAHSKQDRDEWIEAIRKALPTSPRQPCKNEGTPKRIIDEPKEKIPSDPPPPYDYHLTTTARQDTAAVAATVATENERLNGVDESITSIDESLHDQPTLDVRRDTAATAALSLSLSHNNQTEDDSQTENDQLTSIDDVLGPRETNTDKESDMSDESSQRTGTPSDSNSIQTQSPEPEPVNNEGDETLKTEVRENGVEEATVKTEGEDDARSEPNPPLPPPTEVVENLQTSVQQDKEDVVVTSVTVEVNRESPVAVCDESECTIKNQNDVEGEKVEEEEGSDAPKSEGGESQEAKTEGETSEKNDKSTLVVEKVPTKGGGEEEGGEGIEVLISQEPRSNSFSVNVANIDTDEYSSSEDESTQPPPFVEEGAANATPTQEVTSSGEPPKANGDCPTITVEKPEGEKKDEEGKEKRSGSESSSEGERLSPPAERRRTSQPFIEKKGFLYKMGGKRKNWNLRYFILRPGVFTYSKNPNSKSLGEVKLKNLQVFYPGLGERKTSFQFTIHTESTWNKRMDWILAAQSEREMKDWIQAFKLAGQKNMLSPATSDNELESST